jgi:hypothetical protein
VSTPVRLTVGPNFPGATILRGSQSVRAGRSAVLAIQLVGSATVQWLRDGRPVPGATATTLTIAGAGVDDEGLYTVLLTNSRGTTEVVVGRLSVLQAPPVFVVEPRNLTGSAGARLALTARVTGRGRMHYTWLRNGKPVNLPAISGQGTNRLVFEKFLPIHAGDYQLEVRNAFGVARSRVARVRVRVR